MKIIKTKLDKKSTNTTTDTVDLSTFTLPERTLLFDIETTGLSADTSYLYLIGAIGMFNDELTLIQWFCDKYSEEKEVLLSFKDTLADFNTLIHYNGTGFDIPYLNKKFKRHCISFEIDAAKTTDIYKILLPFKKHTCFPDFKQKTLEQSAGFLRTDTFSGGDLTEVYAAYAGKFRLATLTGNTEEADALRFCMLLHNHDDLIGLLYLYQKTALPDFYAGKLLPSVIKTGQGILFSFDLALLPFPLSLQKNSCSISITERTTDLFLPLWEGELKYFFKDYKNYSYLKFEDTAVHNSVAEWVDKEAKEKCRPATAYQKKAVTFLILPFEKPEKEPVLDTLPLFFSDYRSLPAYVEYSDSLVCNPYFINSCFKAFLP